MLCALQEHTDLLDGMTTDPLDLIFSQSPGACVFVSSGLVSPEGEISSECCLVVSLMGSCHTATARG